MLPITAKPSSFKNRLWDQRYLYLMIVPCVVWLIIFAYIPMGGIVIAFKNYKLSVGIFASDWVGLKWFKQLLGSRMVGNVVKNTIGISMMHLVFGFPMPILLALLINEINNKRYLRLIQSVSYMPHFLSWVIVIALFQELFSLNGGAINTLLGSLFGVAPRNFFMEEDSVWGLAFWTARWKEMGWSAIIYIAALSGIDPAQHEAAIVDGANKFQRIWHINLPGILPTIMILLIMQSGHILDSNFDQLYMMRNDAVLRTVEVIDTYVYERMRTTPTSYSFNTAVTLLKSLINVGMLLGVNAISQAATKSSLF